MLFPVEGVRPGDTTVDLTVTADVEEVSAKVRRSFEVPKPPKPGEAHPWFLSDHQVRFGESVVLAPSLDEVVSPGEAISFIGYGCRSGKAGAAASFSGRLVPFSGGAPVPVPITWLDESPKAGDSCSWLYGRVDAALAPGLWSFEPPKELASAKKAVAPVEFSVVSDAPAPSTPATLPAELQPKPSSPR